MIITLGIILTVLALLPPIVLTCVIRNLVKGKNKNV